MNDIKSIEIQIKIAFIFAFGGLNSLFWTSLVLLIIPPFDRRIILLSAILWLVMYILMIIFLRNAGSFLKKLEDKQKITSKNIFFLIIASYSTEVLLTAFQISDIVYWIFNAIMLVMILLILSIHQRIIALDIKQIQKHREVQRIDAEVAKEMQAKDKRLTKIEELLTLIKQFRNDVPVLLGRIAELLKISKNEVEIYLKEILVYQENLGEYLELEQVFIKHSVVEKKTEEVIQNTASKPFSSLQKCTTCNTTQSVLIRQCINCNNILPYCHICKRGFADGDITKQCPHCTKQFHSVHILAYIQSKGACPVCRKALNDKILM
ncbi:MAG: hypothetical protein OEZ01_04190 [Candidatus Heimdallarchaeota archaeon]|nr:hypothetical protein [Candidatus Heimdallarchaeota archaeon]MDH5645180.1 hypothetical protein [Candidatus Heimdallarchaeota archaeon]